MKKPLHGDQLMIRYQGATFKATCGEVVETPDRGTGSARFTIVSQTIFQRGSQAVLVAGPDELSLQVERVTLMGHRKLNIVSFHAAFSNTASPEGQLRPT